MKWAYTIKQKQKAAIMLGIVFLFVFAKSWLDERNVSELGNSFASVYEDRLLAESYIYQLSNHLYQKKIMLDNCNSQEDVAKLQASLSEHNQAISAIIQNYEKTKLTGSETALFTAFKRDVAAINDLESDYLKFSARQENTTKASINDKFTVVAGNLQQLSDIQVAEGKMLNDKSKAIMAGSTILTQFELVVLIGIGLLIQGLIFASRSSLPKKPQQFGLN